MCLLLYYHQPNVVNVEMVYMDLVLCCDRIVLVFCRFLWYSNGKCDLYFEANISRMVFVIFSRTAWESSSSHHQLMLRRILNFILLG